MDERTTRRSPDSDHEHRPFDRIAGLYDLLLLPLEILIMRRHRRSALRRIRDHRRILEVGIGTGANMPYYLPPDEESGAVSDAGRSPTAGGSRRRMWDEFAGIDLSPRMLSAAQARAQQLGIDHHIDLHEMDVEDMGFPDDHFDCVVATCVFCSVRDPVRGLSEIRRVLRPGGEAVLLEHVRSGRWIPGRVMDGLNPLSVRLVGEHINRDPVRSARAAGLDIRLERDLVLDILKEIVAVKPV